LVDDYRLLRDGTASSASEGHPEGVVESVNDLPEFRRQDSPHLFDDEKRDAFIVSLRDAPCDAGDMLKPWRAFLN